MDIYYYAELNEDNVCFAVGSLAGEVISEHNILIDKESDDYIGRKYENGQWSEEKYSLTETEPQPTIEEQILFETQYQTLLLEMSTLGGM